MPAAGQGIDAAKKIPGRKRHIGIDTIGLLLVVLVTAVSVFDNAGGIRLLSSIAEGQLARTMQMSALAARTAASLSTLSRVVSRLGKRELLARNRVPGSGRRTTATLAEAGCE